MVTSGDTLTLPRGYIDAMIKLDQEPFYLNTADYRAYAERTFAEQKQLMGELGFKPE